MVTAELKGLHVEAGTRPDAVEARARELLAELPADAPPWMSAWAWLALGACGLARTDVRLALESLATATESFGAAHDDEGLLAALVLLVNAWVLVGDRPEARLTAGRALRLARRLGAKATEARLLVNLAYTHGEDDDAISYEMLTQQALDIFTTLGDQRAMAHCHVNLGGALTRSKQWSEARQHYDRAERLCRNTDSPYIEALLWAGRGGLAVALGDWETALGMYAESNRRLTAQGRDYQRLRQEWLLGRDLLALGELELAASRLTMMVAEAAVAGYDGLVASAHETLAALRSAQGDAVQAAMHQGCAEEARAAASAHSAGAELGPPNLVAAVARARSALSALRSGSTDSP